MFRKPRLFNEQNVRRVPEEAGVYIIYTLDGQPVYVGRSWRNIRTRLLRHLHRRGNCNIALAIKHGIPLEFEWECMISVEQAEAILIKELGTCNFFNLRQETDPADWE
jgi:excinuclease UvrABC nuclease subunit